MSHHHYCDVTGHEWECEGTALRLHAGEIELRQCICMRCGVPMEVGDHSNCPIELLTCPEHLEERVRAIDELAPEPDDESLPPAPHCECGCANADPENVVGWCMWCDHVYVEYNPTTEDQHFAHHCPDAPQELKDRATARLGGVERDE